MTSTATPPAPLADGLWGVVATPFLEDGSLDLDSLRRLVGTYQGVGATGLTVLGVFGEAASLSTAERRAVLEAVRDEVDLPLVVGATSLATAPAIEEVQRITETLGDRLAGAMIQLNSADPAVLADHLNAIAHATGAGIVAQNYPVASGVQVPADREIAALSQVDHLVAIKSEAPPTAVRVAALTKSFDVPVFGGLGGIGLLDELACGAAGAMTGFSFPEGLLAAVRAFREGGAAAARAALLPYLPMITFEQQPGIALAIRKYCLTRRGLIATPTVRRPAPDIPQALVPLADAHLAAVESERVA